MSIPEILPYVQFFGQFALIAGALFAGYQFLLHRRERDEHAALEMLTSLQTQEFRAAYARVWMLPLQADPQVVRGHIAAGGRGLQGEDGGQASAGEQPSTVEGAQQGSEELPPGPEAEHAAVTVAMTFESIGVMVHNRIVPLDAVDQVIGGFLRESWRRLEPYIQDQRRVLGAPRYAEWYQWLAERVEVRRRRRTVPAYEAFKEWRE